MTEVEEQIRAMCTWHGQHPPARASLYHLLRRLDGHEHEVSSLPAHVGQALYDVDPRGSIGGARLAFYCLNYGSIEAASFAAGLPWLDLYQASHLRGWRSRSLALLRAVLHVRGI